MSERPISPGLKIALDIGPVLVFFAGYLALRDKVFTIAGTEYSGFILVTAVFIPLIALTTFILWRLTGVVSRMQIMTLVIVVLFGGMTIYFNDERFFKMKPTILYAAIAGILGFGLLRGQSYLHTMMSELMPLQQEGWMILTRRLAAFFAGLAVLNEFVWRNFSTDAWVNFKTFGLTLLVFGFFIAQAGLMQRYAIPEDEE